MASQAITETSTLAAAEATVRPTSYEVSPGSPHPLGATPDAGGVNFSIFSEHATSVDLLLFDNHDDPEPVQVISLDSAVNKSFHFWHVYVNGLQPGMHYGYRVDGPKDLNTLGHRFDREKILLDPYAKGTTHTLWNRKAACAPGDNLGSSMRAVVIDSGDYDWEGDRPIRRPLSESVIYEVHVGGFTKSATAGVSDPGTFSALIEKIPYLKQLGVTAVELMPVFDFDELEIDRPNPSGGPPLRNYWGYSTLSFFTPHHAYCKAPEAGAHLREFRDMVKAMHKAGIEVILDVVFNHTAEGNHLGPTINFKGLDNSIYYHLVPSDRQYFMDYSGCGNTFNCNHPIADKFIVECLRFWVQEMHVDGFRFDEGSILARGEDGAPMAYPPLIWHIELSEELADTKIIAEAWDAAGLYQIGYFPGYRWAEWNGRYRDDIRRFVRGDRGIVGAVASRIAGSADIYQPHGHMPTNSINFITCHDGFTLKDLVSYNSKHNEANGENNQDGNNDNTSWNCGVEGETEDAGIREFRKRQVKNFAATLLLSRGVPMLLSGDEMLRTQHGNNNAYCQDSDLSWIDWDLAQQNADVVRFFRLMIDLRKRHRSLTSSQYFTGEVRNDRGLPDIAWHGCNLNQPGWNDPGSGVLAFTLGGEGGEEDVHVMLNMEGQDLEFELPPITGRSWYRAVDTAQPSPQDIAEPGRETLWKGSGRYPVRAHSAVVLISR